jgi:thiol-disulfide isomerase/thioredoxin
MIAEARDDNFDELKAGGVALIDFYSTHCGPCRALLPTLLKLEGEMPFITLIKVNTDNCPELAERYQILSLPTLYLSRDGEMEPLHAWDEDEMRAAIGKLLYE